MPKYLRLPVSEKRALIKDEIKEVRADARALLERDFPELLGSLIAEDIVNLNEPEPELPPAFRQ